LERGLGDRAGFNAVAGSYNVFLGAEVTGIHGTQLTGPAVQVFVDASGQLGTLTPPMASGTGTTPAPLALQQAQDQQAINAAHEATINELKTANAELGARLARLEALVVAGSRRR
jgi:hypothetical protein